MNGLGSTSVIDRVVSLLLLLTRFGDRDRCIFGHCFRAIGVKL